MPERRHASAAQAAAEPAERQLIVGKGIAFNGDIDNCDRLIVEGQVEVSLSGGRSIEITESGLFKGTAEVDYAEIRGRLEGTLTVRQRLDIRSTGRVTGTVRYSELAVEPGGQLAGDVGILSGAPSSTAAGMASAPRDQSPSNA